jgi:hypothetical protein
VADIYEDRLRLFGVADGGTVLTCRAAPVRRTPELARLTGLRYAGEGRITVRVELLLSWHAPGVGRQLKGGGSLHIASLLPSAFQAQG